MAEEMNDGVCILIARMESNPEDFALRGPRDHDSYVMGRFPSMSWRQLADMVVEEDKQIFTKEEKAAISAALIKVSRTNFTAKVLERLTTTPQEPEEEAYEKHAMAKSAGNFNIVGASQVAVNNMASSIADYQRGYQQSLLGGGMK